ncbi:MAG: YfiR family protein [Candidatus Aminicenantes bacterium]|nr:YfiR family protein [Candidatus Aminicenantes bacterium]
MKTAAILILFIISSLMAAAFPESTFDEYAVKAAFLELVSNYIEWPRGQEPDEKYRPFVITVIGENPFVITRKVKNTTGDWLTTLYEIQKIKNRKVEIRYISEIEDIPGCHILFVSRSMKKKLTEIVDAARQKPILTVADTEGFAKKGIHINLYIENYKTRYEINRTGLKSSPLIVNYRLFEWGKPVNTVKE